VAAYLVLDDGRIFEGEPWACTGETFGEAVFSTGMTGYQETLTDPSYHKQVVIMTAPHIGNTGMNSEDEESRKIWVSGFVVRNPSPVVSNWRAERSLEDDLIKNNVVGIQGIDTRALTLHLRDRGAMRVGIFSDSNLSREEMVVKVRSVKQMSGSYLADDVSTEKEYVVAAQGERKFKVAALDLGIKAATPRNMSERGIEVHMVPVTTTYADLKAADYDAQNHGFAVEAPIDGDFTTVYGAGRVTHFCLNDGVVEGLRLLERPAFSVQYHPEAAAGPHDANYLFDDFLTMLENHAAR